jgi:hypothetical protein
MLLGVIADSDKEINASKKITMFQKKNRQRKDTTTQLERTRDNVCAPACIG